ncbi:MAG: DAK2 domain-containing protein [Hungatella sp.]|nr:DAK2 domain-containing protein [Hungatella sp.]
MGMNTIDAKTLQRAFLAGAKGLEAKKEWINELNVFPVPDGDTGTNMTMTIMSAAREVAAIEEPTMENLAKAISSGSLRGARGNSGVILSQLFRGFTKEIKPLETITTTTLANAFVRAAETAYKAVMKPKEGTILTVAKGMADKAVELVTETEDVIEFAQKVIAHGDYVLSQTPEMLPILKQAGVVDSGGQGLMQVMKGCLDGLLGKETDLNLETGAGGSPQPVSQAAQGPALEEADIKFGYCTEFIINVEKEYGDRQEREFKTYLESIGDSIVVVSDDDVVKVHVHTNDPGLAIQKALTFGSLSRMKIDNMREEHQERLIMDAEKKAGQEKGQAALGGAGQMASGQQAEEGGDQPRKEYGFIAVSIGRGFGEIFQGIGADYLIEGGQTMNPSTEDMLNAIDKVNADTIYILPNNSNIILAAEQAASLAEDKDIVVVPSKTVPQGITAIINFAPDLSPQENKEAMMAEMGRVKTGQITYAVRDTVIDDKEIHSGDIMGIGDAGILCVGKSVMDTTLDTLKSMVDGDSELITIYYGVDIGQETAEKLLERVEEAWPDCEVELHSGGQPIYYYLMSVE